MKIVPFVPLMLLFSYTIMASIPVSSSLNPSDLCPLIDIVDHELCHAVSNSNASSSPVQELCVLLQKYNASFCSSHEHHDKMMSDDAMSVRILHNEYYANQTQETQETQDIHKVCPIINFIEEELCASRVHRIEFDPKELCPLLNLTYTEFCS
jgi:hypothetical protein